MKTHLVFSAFIAAGVALAGFSSCGLKKEKISPAQPIKVTVLPVGDSSVAAGRTYSGTVDTGDGGALSFSVAGTVKAVYFSAGQKVRKGQLLAELKDDNLVNANNISQAALAEAQDAYNRFKKLHDANALADMKWVEVQRTLEEAQNAAAVAQRAVSDARLTAPVSGTVSEKSLEVGQSVLPAVPVGRIVALGDVKVTIPVPESEVGAFKEGSKARIVIGALDSLEITGTLSEKEIEANPLTRAYTVKYTVDNTSGRLLPGMLCEVSPEGLVAADARGIVLPSQAVLLSADNRNFVWLAKDGKAERRFVDAGDITADGIVITSGIAPGDSVIIAGMQKVSTGTAVEPQL